MDYLFSIMWFDRYRAQITLWESKTIHSSGKRERKHQKNHHKCRSLSSRFIMCMVMFCAICFQNVMSNV